MKTYSNDKRLIEWAEKFDDKRADGQQWAEKDFGDWRCYEVDTTRQANMDLP